MRGDGDAALFSDLCENLDKTAVRQIRGRIGSRDPKLTEESSESLLGGILRIDAKNVDAL